MTDERRLGCAVIGVGWMGMRHARVWTELPITRLVCVYDANSERAAGVATALGCDVAASLEDAVGRDEVQLVSVCTPDSVHVGPSVAAAAAGKHVLVEKPLATTVTDAQAIVSAAERAGVKLMVGHILRFDPHYAVARSKVQEGAIGELIYAFARRYNVLSGGRRVAASTTVVSFLGIHDIDALQWVTGVPITRVFAVGARKLMADMGAHDAVASVLEFANGACGCLESLWVNPDIVCSSLDARMELVGTGGRVAVAVDHEHVVVSTLNETKGCDVVYAPVVNGRIGGALRLQLEHFAWCVMSGQEPLVDNKEAVRAVAVAEAIQRSLDVGQAVEVT